MPSRLANGKFAPGASGNPGGKPRDGGKNLTQTRAQFRKAFLEQADRKLVNSIVDVIEAVIKQAKSGDMQAAKLILDRLVPAQRAVDPARKGIGGIQILVQGANPSMGPTVVIDQTPAQLEPPEDDDDHEA